MGLPVPLAKKMKRKTIALWRKNRQSTFKTEMKYERKNENHENAAQTSEKQNVIRKWLTNLEKKTEFWVERQGKTRRPKSSEIVFVFCETRLASFVLLYKRLRNLTVDANKTRWTPKDTAKILHDPQTAWLLCVEEISGKRHPGPDTSYIFYTNQWTPMTSNGSISSDFSDVPHPSDTHQVQHFKY